MAINNRFGDTFLSDWRQFYGGPVTSLYMLDSNGSPLIKNGNPVKNTYGKVNKAEGYTFDTSSRVKAVLDTLQKGNYTADDINMMQRRHAGLYAGYDSLYSPVDSELVRNYQDDYNNFGYNQSVIAPGYNKNYSHASLRPISGDSPNGGWKSDGRYDQITDDRRVLARKEDYLNADGTINQAALDKDIAAFKEAGLDYYLDPESNYYMIRKLNQESDNDPCIQSYIAQGMDAAEARAHCLGGETITRSPAYYDFWNLSKKMDEEDEGIKGDDAPEKSKKTNWLEKLRKTEGALRVAAGNYANMRNTEEYNKHLRPPLQTPWQAHKVVYGDYIAKRLGEQLSARFQSMASRPITSDASLQLAGLLEAVEKGAQQVLAGQQRDAAQYYRTRDEALNQAIQNIQVRTQIANTNRQLMAQIEQMKARNVFNAKTLNMLNWDRWASQWEDRALAKYDYNQQKKRNLQELMDALSDLLGVNDDLYRQKYYEWIEETDPAKKAVLELKLIDLKKKNQLLVYRNMGDRNGVSWNSQWTKVFEDNGISSMYKNGGILRRLQQGGGFPLVQWTPNMGGGAYLQYLSLLMSSGNAGTSSKASKSSKSSDSDKEETTLLKNIVETLKGADLLSSDMDILSGQLKKFFDILRYAPEGLSVDHLYRGYIDALSNVNRAKLSANNFKQAYNNTLKNGGLHEAAIDSQGMIYVGVIGTGEMKAVTPTQYLENKESLRLLTNEDLLYLRLTQPKYAFNDKVLTGVVSNGVGMEEVGKFIKQFVGSLGNNKESKDQMVYTFGHQAAQGILVLQDLVRNGFTDEQTAAIMAGGVDGLWELNTLTQSQVQQAKLALEVILQSLPKNMLSLLILRAGGTLEAAALVGKMILSGTSTQSAFNIKDLTALDETGNLKSSTKTGKGGSESDEALDRTLTNILRGMGGSSDRLVINPGTKSQLEIDVTNYLVPGAYTAGNLEEVLNESKLTGISIKTNIYFGDLKLPTERLGDIAYLGRGFSRAVLPIKGDGSPDLSIIDRYETACDNIRKKGFDPVKIMNGQETNVEALRVFSDELQKAELYGLIDRLTGLPNLSRVGVFLVTEGLGSSKAGLKPSTYVRLKENADYDLMSLLLSRKGTDGKIQEYELDRPDWGGFFPGDWFGMYDSIYEGTIYIPISINELQGSTASSNKVKTSTAEAMERSYQSFENLRRYNPGSGTPDNILSQ